MNRQPHETDPRDRAMTPQFSFQSSNLLGGILAILIYLLVISLLLARLGGYENYERVLGIILILLIFPLTYLLISAFYLDRPRIYVLQVGLMILFLIVELALDYIFEVPFRTVKWQTIAYVTLFFGATGGMIGVASLAGRVWSAAAVIGFLVMGGVSLLQRHITGL